MNQLKKNPLFYLSIVLVGIISFQFYSLVSAQSQWNQPSGPPPMSNIAAPLDTSNVIQLKKGSLTISADGVPDGNGGVNPGHAIDFLVNGSQPASLVFDAGATWTALKYDDATGYFSVTNPNGPLFLSDRTLGLRFPNIASTAATAVAGNVIFDPTSKSLQLYNGTSWGSVSSGGAGVSGGQAGYLPLWKSATTLATSSVFQDTNGSIGIGTVSPQTTLSVQGNVLLLRQPGAGVLAGTGPSMTLESPSSEVSVSAISAPVQCSKSGNTCSGKSDDTGTTLENPKTDCVGLTVGREYTDVYSFTATGGSSVYQYQTIMCKSNTSQYSLVVNNGTLEFLNNKGMDGMTLGQDGSVTVNYIGLVGTSTNPNATGAFSRFTGRTLGFNNTAPNTSISIDDITTRGVITNFLMLYNASSTAVPPQSVATIKSSLVKKDIVISPSGDGCSTDRDSVCAMACPALGWGALGGYVTATGGGQCGYWKCTCQGLILDNSEQPPTTPTTRTSGYRR